MGACDVTPEFPSWPETLQALCLGHKPKARVITPTTNQTKPFSSPQDHSLGFLDARITHDLC